MWSLSGLNVDEHGFLLMLQTVRQKAMERCETGSLSMSTLNGRISGVSSADIVGFLTRAKGQKCFSPQRHHWLSRQVSIPASSHIHKHTTIQNH